MERLEELCKDMINRHEYQKCENGKIVNKT